MIVARGVIRPVYVPPAPTKKRSAVQIIRAALRAAPIAYAMSAAVGAFALTGQSATLALGRVLPADVGAFTLTGQAATLRAGNTLDGGAGAFTLTGQSAALRRQWVMPSAVGSFALTGNNAILLKGKLLSAGVGSFALTGQAAIFVYGVFQTGQHQLALFPSPVNGGGPIDANIVRANDNITAIAFNAHDADTAIHIRSGALAARPATATEGSVYVGTDTLLMYIFTGGSWSQVL